MSLVSIGASPRRLSDRTPSNGEGGFVRHEHFCFRSSQDAAKSIWYPDILTRQRPGFALPQAYLGLLFCA
jgi:hypothetical protein